MCSSRLSCQGNGKNKAKGYENYKDLPTSTGYKKKTFSFVNIHEDVF